MNLPTTSAGVTCRDAVVAAIQPGMAGPVVDLAGAMALATAGGVPGHLAAALVTAAAEGVVIGFTEKREAEKEGEDGTEPPDAAATEM